MDLFECEFSPANAAFYRPNLDCRKLEM